MATYRLRHFTSPHVLRSIEVRRLLAFLEPYRAFFMSRSSALPRYTKGLKLDYQQLIDIFMSPTEDTPRELLDALFLVDEMATHEGMEILLEAASDAGLQLDDGDEHTPADIAVQVWLLDRDILERKHAEQFLYKPNRFEYFQNERATRLVCNPLSAQARQKLESEMARWFEKKRRGEGTRVFVYPDDQEVRFLIRHGEPFKRDESLTGPDVVSVNYRPLKYDVVVFDRETCELRINARLVGEKKLYRELIGLHVFDDRNAFPGTSKFSLEPLREFGEDALACGDVDGIEDIVLKEIHFFWGGSEGDIEIRKAHNVFAALAARRREFPERARILKAVFKIRFSDSPTPRSISIQPSNIAKYTRDDDAGLIDQWLRLRGFIKEVTRRAKRTVGKPRKPSRR